MRTFIFLLICIILLSGCRSREPMEIFSDKILDPLPPVKIAAYTGNAIVKRSNGDPCKFALIYMPDTYSGYKNLFYADTKGFVCLKYYMVLSEQSDPQEYINTSCIIYMNQFEKIKSYHGTIEVKFGEECLDDGINPLVVVFPDSSSF